MTSNTKRLCPGGGGAGLGKRREEAGKSNIVGFKILMSVSYVLANNSFVAPS